MQLGGGALYWNPPGKREREQSWKKSQKKEKCKVKKLVRSRVQWKHGLCSSQGGIGD